MPKGVEKTKQTVESLAALVADVVAVAHGGLNMNSLPKLFEIINDIRRIVEAAPGAFPELAELDAHEASELGGIAYMSITEMVEQIRSLIKK